MVVRALRRRLQIKQCHSTVAILQYNQVNRVLKGQSVCLFIMIVFYSPSAHPRLSHAGLYRMVHNGGYCDEHHTSSLANTPRSERLPYEALGSRDYRGRACAFV